VIVRPQAMLPPLALLKPADRAGTPAALCMLAIHHPIIPREQHKVVACFAGNFVESNNGPRDHSNAGIGY